MGKKGLASIFSRLIVDSTPSSSSSPAAGPATPPWPWPPCGTNPQTASFRAGASGEEPCCTTAAAAGASRGGDPAAAGNNNKQLMARGAAPGEMYKTVNSVYLDDPAADVDFFSLAGDEAGEGDELLDDVDSFSTTTASEEWSEAVIRSLGRTSTDRFFFDPGPLPASNSILATAAAPSSPPEAKTESKTKTVTPPDTDDDDGEDAKPQQPSKSLAEGSVAVAVDSGDPYGDFRASMEEMVSAHGLRDWAALEELLAWYLRINGKQHHHLIVGAFVDLLLGLASSCPSDTAAETSTSSSGGGSGSACAGSRCTTSTSTSTSTAATSASAAGDATTTSAPTVTTASAADGQCGGGSEAAACCSSSSSCAAGPDAQDDVADEEEEEKASSAATATTTTGDDRVSGAPAPASAPLRAPQSIA